LLFWLCHFFYTQAEVTFIENKGQWHDAVLFMANMHGGNLFLEEGGFTYLFYENEALHEFHESKQMPDSIQMHSLKVRFKNGQIPTSVEKYEEGQGVYNYFIGKDKSKWASSCKSYSKVILKNVYPHIDFEFYENGGNLKYNFIVNEGGKAKDIKLEYLGADELKLKNGSLEVTTSVREIIELPPVVYQESKDNVIGSAYKLNGNVLSFDIDKGLKRRNKFVIDPVLVFSTYSGSRGDNFGFTATYDEDGNAYSGGVVYETGFPVTTGAFQSFFKGTSAFAERNKFGQIDAAILKYAPDGKSLVYATYLGGYDGLDYPHSMVVDTNGYLLIMGTTSSDDFPMPSNEAFDDSHNGLSDIFLARLSKDGTQLLHSTYLGGENYDGQNGSSAPSPLWTSNTHFNYSDEFRGEIIVGEDNDIFVISCSKSFSFPLRNSNVLKQNKLDAVAFRMSGDMETLIWSSFFGGEDDDAGFGMDFGKFGDLYITGGTKSKNFKPALTGLNKSLLGGRADGWLIHLNSSTGEMTNGTYVGSNDYDQSYFVKTDNAGKPFIYGQSRGSIPIIGNVYKNTNSFQFIQKYAFDLSSIELSTTFGSGNKNGVISPSAFLVDKCERIMVSGWGGSTNGSFGRGNTSGFPVKDAYQSGTDGSDFYIATFGKDLETLIYGTYFGGNNSAVGSEHVDGGTSRFDPNGIIYQSVCASCDMGNAFPTTPGAWSTTNKGKRPSSSRPGCNNALFKIDFELNNKKPVVKDDYYELVASEILSFDIIATDTNKKDVLEMFVNGAPLDDANFPLPKATISSNNNKISPLLRQFNWQTNCNHLTGDTLELKIKVYDHGCPTTDSNFATIKILVKPPPLVELPDYLCIKPNDNKSLEVWWKDMNTNKYFKQMSLYKIELNGDTTLLQTYTSGTAGKYLDLKVIDPKKNNYCYFFKATNICDMETQMNSVTCSQVELNASIDPTEIITATVVNDKAVKVVWKKSEEMDFNSYDVFKKKRDDPKNGGWVYLASISDVNTLEYIDGALDVDAESNCYTIMVTDNCGHVSNLSNRGCNIVLTGEAENYSTGHPGTFRFNLNWQDYDSWYNGVQDFELKRSVDTGSLRSLVKVDHPTMNYKDDDLDYCWGGYYYQVRAFEDGTKSDSTNDAVSVSNTIYLIQPPLLHVPSAFTPNFDNLNDNWGIVPVFVKTYNIKVFNRWGEKVYESSEKKKQWMGEYSGINDPHQNVFVWIVEYTGWDGSRHFDRGDVTILR